MKPSEPGWYWYKDDGTYYFDPEWQPAHMSEDKCIRLFWGCCEDSLYRLDQLRGQWGPKLPEPSIGVEEGGMDA